MRGNVGSRFNRGRVRKGSRHEVGKGLADIVALSFWQTDTMVAPSPQAAKTTSKACVQVAAPLTPVHGPSVWYADEYKNSDTWVYHLTDLDLKELTLAVEGVQKSGKDIKDVTQVDFPLPTLGPRLIQIRDEVVNGRGFQLLRGFPVGKFTTEQTVIGYWGLGTYWGKAVSQNKKHHLIGHVKDLGLPGGHHDIVNRVYATYGAQPYHCDPVDVVGLLCLKQAKEGGLSSWSSSHAVHNELLQRAPELASELAQPLFLDRKNEIPAGKGPFYKMPVFNYHKGRLIAFYENSFYQAAQRHPEVGPLSEAQLKAIDTFDAIAASDKLRMDWVLQPGDLQLLNNHQVVHTRAEFVDHEEWEKKRHLLRLWVAPPNGWPIPEEFEERYGSNEIGNRGGIVIPGFEPRVPLDAE
ncbi:hypothetical protein WJX72_005474 [[Myrmecia] bisecta]|uniref:TauD/TfdA-like domain-containing protein n=1 Tax=[Myrmecia] bisecta TaxID=41462 RepID=A0AAW1P1G8_9CHLO